MKRCTVSLSALSGEPLAEPAVRAMVVSLARGLAERNAVEISSLETTGQTIVVTLGVERLTAIGFLAELRRDSNAWYERKYRDGPLWGTVAPGETEQGDED